MRDCVSQGARFYYERDGKCWDATMGPEHAAMRVWIYGLYSKSLADFAQACNNVRGFAITGETCMIYSVESTVKSGHNDTTLGNSLINALIAALVFNSLGLRASVIVAGDDLLVAVYSDFDLAVVMDRERAFGINPEARKFAGFNDVSFISGIFANSGDDIYFIPKPGRMLAKLFWTVSPPSDKHLVPYRRGVARGLLPSSGCVPVVREFLRAFDSDGPAIYNPRAYSFQTDLVSPVGGLMDWFCARYGVSAREVDRLEALLSTVPACDCYISDPLLDRMVQVDCADIDDRETLDFV
jgi:hypothetical protein